MGNVWTVPAIVVKVVDGDTMHLRLDLGWHITFDARCRLAGINAPEMDTEEGHAARAFVIDLLAAAGGAADGSGAQVTFVSHQLDKYGRPLGQVLGVTQQGTSFDVASELLHAGHGVVMKG